MNSEYRIIHVCLSGENLGEKIAALEKAWKQVFPEFGFDYRFVDEGFGRMYENETQIAEPTEQFAVLAMLITCVGLYGLAAFLVRQRIQEIGIRKTLGASERQILGLLLRVFGLVEIVSEIRGQHGTVEELIVKRSHLAGQVFAIKPGDVKTVQ